MNMRTLGRTGIQVSEIGLGCEHLEGKDEAVVRAVVHRALDRGVNILDVFMPNPDIRDKIGRALDGRRQDVVLQGHIGAIWKDGQYLRTRDRALCEEGFTDWLRRYSTDYADIGMIHFIDTMEDLDRLLDGLLDYVRHLKAEGTIRAIGLSSHNPEVARKAVATGLIDVLMFSLNPVFDLLPGGVSVERLFQKETFDGNTQVGLHPDRDALYRACVKAGTAITVMKAYAGGMLLHAPANQFGKALRPEQCMHYALTRPAVASVLAGCQTPEEVDAAVAYETASEEARDFSDVLFGHASYAIEGQCMYCNHCLPCPSRIDIAKVLQYLDLAKQSDGSTSVPPTIQAHYDALSAHASDCIRCGACEHRCPFSVPVMERMDEAAALFGM